MGIEYYRVQIRNLAFVTHLKLLQYYLASFFILQQQNKFRRRVSFKILYVSDWIYSGSFITIKIALYNFINNESRSSLRFRQQRMQFFKIGRQRSYSTLPRFTSKW